MAEFIPAPTHSPIDAASLEAPVKELALVLPPIGPLKHAQPAATPSHECTLTDVSLGMPGGGGVVSEQSDTFFDSKYVGRKTR